MRKDHQCRTFGIKIWMRGDDHEERWIDEFVLRAVACTIAKFISGPFQQASYLATKVATTPSRRRRLPLRMPSVGVEAFHCIAI